MNTKYLWVKTILTIISISVFINSYSQNTSININTVFQKDKIRTGFNIVLEDKRFQFKAAVLTDAKELNAVIQAGPVLGYEEGRTRFIISPKLVSNIRTNHFKVYITPEFNVRLNKFTLSLGADCAIKKTNSFIINENENRQWKSYVPTITPSITVEYLMYGKRLKLNKVKSEKVILPDLNWNRWNTYAFILGLVDGAIRGASDAFYADPYFFEKKGFNGLFWAHNGWEAKYANNSYLDENGNVNPMKSQFFGNFGRDYKHTADDISKFTSRYMGIALGISAGVEVLKVIKHCDDRGIGHRIKNKVVKRTIGKEIIKASLIWGVSSLLENKVYSTRY